MRYILLTLLALTVPASLGDAQADALADLTVEVMIKSDGMSDYYKAEEAQRNGKFSEAIKWYRIAIKKKNPLAQYALGYSYFKGRGVPKDNSKAVKWYRKAAGQGLPEAQVLLGHMYANGRGVRTNATEAAKWYRVAAVKGVSKAQILLAKAYQRGFGVSKDYSKAVKWYRRAAKQEVPKAQKALAMLYADGQGVRRDRVKALMWLNIAEIRGRHKDVSDKTFLSSAFLAKKVLSKEMDIVSRAEAKFRTKICLISFYLWCG